MKFAACNEFFEDWPIEKVFDTLKEIGYDGVELAPFTLADSVDDIPLARRDELRRAAESRDLQIVGLHWLLVKPEDLHITHPDAHVRNRTTAYLRSLIDFCGDLGGRLMVFGSPKQRDVVHGQTPAGAREAAKHVFERVLPLAAQRGVTICMEPLAESNFIRTSTEARALIDEINHPSFRIVCDVKSMCAEPDTTPADIIRAQNEQVAHVHANDANRRGPGFGDTNFKPIFHALKDILYIEYLSVEVFDFKPDPVTIATRSLAYLKQCLAEVEQEHTHAS